MCREINSVPGELTWIVYIVASSDLLWPKILSCCGDPVQGDMASSYTGILERYHFAMIITREGIRPAFAVYS